MSTARYLVGDVFERMAELPDGSVDLIMTSPPFLALRSYLPADHPDKDKEIGSEPTPAAFIDTLLDLTVEWRRILAPHGSIVVELGDTYAGSGGAGGDYSAGGLRDGEPRFKGSARTERNRSRESSRPDRLNNESAQVPRPEQPGGNGWPLAKSLACIPDLYKASLAYGRNLLTGREIEPWRVRNSRPWLRTNPPVGALGGKWRPGSSYCIVATPSGRNYFDEFAIREAEDLVDWFIDNGGGYNGAHYAVFPPTLPRRFIDALSPWRVCQQCGEPSARIVDSERTRTVSSDSHKGVDAPSDKPGGPFGAKGTTQYETLGWTDCGCGDACVPATYEKTFLPASYRDDGKLITSERWIDVIADPGTCDESHWRPGIVLDPFAGSGTTLSVATGLGRDSIGIDIDQRNLDLARERVGMFLVEDDPTIVDVVL